MREITVFTTCHPTDDVRVFEKVACSLADAGFNVGWVGPGWRNNAANGEILPGIDHSLFPKSAGKLGRLFTFVRAYRAGLRRKNTGVYYCPEPDAAAAAFLLARRQRIPVLLDLHELYHGSAKSEWGRIVNNRLTSAVIQRGVRLVASYSAAVMAVNESVLDAYTKMGRLGAVPAYVVRNLPPKWFAGAAATVERPAACFRVMHGKSERSRGTRICLEAAAIAAQRIPNLSVVMFKSSERETMDDLLGACEVADPDGVLRRVVDLRDRISMREMPATIAECDCGLILYGRALGRLSLPNRLFEYMAAGIPVVAPTYSSEIVKVLTEVDCGLSVDAEDPLSVADALVQVASHRERAKRWGANGRSAFLERFSWESEFAPVLRLVANWLRDPSK